MAVRKRKKVAEAPQYQELWDAPAVARKVVKKISEAKLQAKCIAWARERGWWARKFSSPSQRSVPDYLLSRNGSRGDTEARPGAIKLAVEFKAPGKISTQQQWDEQYLMYDAGWDVYECDNFEKFKSIILELDTEAGPAREWLK